ncbi:MAG: family 78 glycoside hydrolase catalytic domain [Flavobacteriales bacterium]|nr:family 78 glycoside hydrolase catalytic domain [Flavobacteriales bacterium]MBT4705403.1 family 78 glycoside hydrolase catalytic domain [Flavobacteriales bacterium]MBT4929846.1 family 78 glycoside hydrolase catalytic domain [Flavobacteriales bacterium]MBT5132220.1 family 78 glycoside hydrolase catalytic domain [Flavobacteriales bacterium]MBT6133063.1 family 78 glycoside hydrolase catalytic domain [Flavobacteriales bacterium]
MKPSFIITLLLAVILFGCGDPVSDLSVTNLRCEYKSHPVGIDSIKPRLSWTITGSGVNRKQSAFQILVASSAYLLDGGEVDMWNSGLHVTDRTTGIPYNGADLQSNTTYYWKIRIWDESKAQSTWSDIGRWTTGLLDSNEWQASWIGYDKALNDRSIPSKAWANGMSQDKPYRPLPSPYLRKEFELNEAPTKALVHATALGLYELYINGHRVGHDQFTPGWTDYNQRLYYNTYEVSKLLRKGKNTIAAVLGDGWYAGVIGIRGQQFYGDRLRLRAQLHMRVGTANKVILTDDSWKASYGAIRESDMQGGETYDARLETTGWNENGFDDTSWKPVNIGPEYAGILQTYPGNPVVQIREMEAASIHKNSDDTYIVDMGQNFAGWAKLKVSGTAGDSIVLRFGEKLNDDGSLYTRNLRTARCTDTYVLKGDGEETWEPRFTYHGYQYVEVSGFPGELTAENIKGIVLHSSLERTGEFTCSDSMINQLFENVLWSQRSNFFEVPTDCPQRDERLGWTGDAQVFTPAAAYNMDISVFYTKWMQDVFDGQFEDGRLPSTAPRVYKRVAAGWGDAGIICPWQFYEAYGDVEMLKKYYPEMTQFMNYLNDTSDAFIGKRGSYGDWQNVDSETPKDVIATAFYKRTSDIMANIADALGKDDDVSKYRQLSSDIQIAFDDSLIDDSGFVKGRTQTGYLMALAFDLVSDSKRELVLSNLVDDIVNRDTTLSTGILGTNLLLPTLSANGQTELAYALLLQTKYPSWGHQIKNGANTMWERWDSYSLEDGINPDSTNSLNHYAYGSVVEWMYSNIAGIQSQDGYKNITIKPQPGGDLTHAKASYKSINGYISSEWQIVDGEFLLNVTIPANTTATIHLPDGSDKVEVGSGQHAFSADYDSVLD